MCGIAGQIFNNKPVSSDILKGIDAIAHRGPDGEGHWIEENIGLGHRRLAIIDTSSAGDQPMISADHRFVLTYNGEVYNFQELRTELKSKGYHFKSQTDSEVVLSALVEWKEEALLKFNGMFALALWDRKEKTLLLARDRYGIKPLYYFKSNSTLLLVLNKKPYSHNLPLIVKLITSFARILYFQNIFTDQL